MESRKTYDGELEGLRWRVRRLMMESRKTYDGEQEDL